MQTKQTAVTLVPVLGLKLFQGLSQFLTEKQTNLFICHTLLNITDCDGTKILNWYL